MSPTCYIFIILLHVLVHNVISDNESDACDRLTQKCPESGITALLLGGSGATGKHVLKELNTRHEISRIIFISRRDIEFPDISKVRLNIMNSN